MSQAEVKAGLEGVVAGNSSISFVDGKEGRLLYRGYNIHDLAQHSTFEEVAYLCWHGELPTRRALDEIRARLAENRALPAEVMGIIERAPKDAHPMDVLRTAVSALGMYDPDAGRDVADRDANIRRAIRLTARTATITAAYDRIRKGQAPVPPRADLSHAANFLYMLKGTEPDDIAERTFDVALVLHVDHEFNASTFAARVTTATLSDMYSAVTSAIGALKGPLHGGANQRVMETLLQIEDPARAEAWIRQRLANKERIMGFGHRVYKVLDPRAIHLERLSRELGERTGQTRWYEMSQVIRRVMEEEKGLYPNVDFYSASAYYALGIDLDLFTPIFAISRMAGWTAHVMEQYADNRLIRPRSNYIGPLHAEYVPIDQRG
ncbi:MAG TPA: citrate synthase [Bacillota bacterium]